MEKTKLKEGNNYLVQGIQIGKNDYNSKLKEITCVFESKKAYKIREYSSTGAIHDFWILKEWDIDIVENLGKGEF